jgi:hypothetical protein
MSENSREVDRMVKHQMNVCKPVDFGLIPEDSEQRRLRILAVMERNQELYVTVGMLQEELLEIKKRILILGKKRPSTALDEMDALIDDIKANRIVK